MKTGDWIQLGALGIVAYLAYQKLAPSKSPAGAPTLPLQPSTQIPIDFGVNNPNDPGWSDNGGNIPTNVGLQNVIDWAF